MDWIGKKVLVLGSTGFIGQVLVSFLLSQGSIVTGISRNSFRLDNPNYNHIIIRSADKIELDNYKYIFHLAGNKEITLEDPGKNIIDFTKVILASLKEPTKTVFIFSSSCSVYGESSNGPIDEGQKPMPISVYAQSKLLVEKTIFDFAKKNKMRATVARIFNVYGENEKTSIISKMIKSLTDKTAFSLDSGLVRDFIHVEDLISGLLHLAENGDYGVYNLGTGVGTNLGELRNLIEKAFNGKIQVNPVCNVQIRNSVANIKKIEKSGWYPVVNLGESLKILNKELIN